MPFIDESKLPNRDKNNETSTITSAATTAPATITRYDVLSALGYAPEESLNIAEEMVPPQTMILSGEKLTIIYTRNQ